MAKTNAPSESGGAFVSLQLGRGQFRVSAAPGMSFRQDYLSSLAKTKR